MFEMDVLYMRQVRRDALATAEKERLIHELEKARAPVQISYRLLMARLGEQMVVWGSSLQARYASS